MTKRDGPVEKRVVFVQKGVRVRSRTRRKRTAGGGALKGKLGHYWEKVE